MSVDDVVWDIPRGKGIRIVSFIPERIISRPNVSFWLTRPNVKVGPFCIMAQIMSELHKSCIATWLPTGLAHIVEPSNRTNCDFSLMLVVLFGFAQ